MSPRRERLYVVRTWLEPGEAGPLWRASVRDNATAELRHFADAAALARFLAPAPDAPGARAGPAGARAGDEPRPFRKGRRR